MITASTYLTYENINCKSFTFDQCIDILRIYFILKEVFDMDLTTTYNLLSNASHFFPWVLLILMAYDFLIVD